MDIITIIIGIVIVVTVGENLEIIEKVLNLLIKFNILNNLDLSID